MAKSCPITRRQFTTHAKAFAVPLCGTSVVANPKTFSTDSVGWYANGKVEVVIDGVKCQVQVGITMTVVGSKELPLEPVVLSPEVQAIRAAVSAKEAAMVAKWQAGDDQTRVSMGLPADMTVADPDDARMAAEFHGGKA